MANYTKLALVSGAALILAGGGGYAFLNRTPVGLPDCYKQFVCADQSVLDKAKAAQITEYHEALLKEFDIDLRVMIGDYKNGLTPENVQRYFKTAKVGERSQSRKGALLMIDPLAQQVRLEISAGLDAVYTDAFVSYLERKQMVPFFQANQVGNGILATTEMIVTRAKEANAGKEFLSVEQVPQNLAIGAGAQTNVKIGEGYQVQQATPEQQKPVSQNLRPLDIVALYHQALEQGNSAYNLPIYSQASQKMRQNWVVTPAQMKNELAAYQKCSVYKEVILKPEGLAVVLYQVDQRECAPYFLVMEDGQWRLDFLTMMNHVKFNVNNEWHLDMEKPLAYADAFLDWSFNKNGYPHPMPKLRWGLYFYSDDERHVTYLRKIYENGGAAHLPLQEGDIIDVWNGIENPFSTEITRNMDELDEGAKFQVQVIRNNQKLTLNLEAPPRLN